MGRVPAVPNQDDDDGGRFGVADASPERRLFAHEIRVARVCHLKRYCQSAAASFRRLGENDARCIACLAAALSFYPGKNVGALDAGDALDLLQFPTGDRVAPGKRRTMLCFTGSLLIRSATGSRATVAGY
jgi:hypothetical protein